MKKSRFTDQQIAFALQQAEGGTPIEEVCRKMGISQATFFRWKKVYGGLMLIPQIFGDGVALVLRDEVCK